MNFHRFPKDHKAVRECSSCSFALAPASRSNIPNSALEHLPIGALRGIPRFRRRSQIVFQKSNSFAKKKERKKKKKENEFCLHIFDGNWPDGNWRGRTVRRRGACFGASRQRPGAPSPPVSGTLQKTLAPLRLSACRNSVRFDVHARRDLVEL